MILVYAAVDGGRELDRVTITPEDVRYATGAAEEVLGTPLRRYGNKAVMSMYRDWSNGYVQFKERV